MENKTPQEIIDYYDKLIRDSFNSFGISFDNYSRTSKTLSNFSRNFQRSKQKKGFQEIESEQLYDSEAKQFLADRYVVGICPI